MLPDTNTPLCDTHPAWSAIWHSHLLTLIHPCVTKHPWTKKLALLGKNNSVTLTHHYVTLTHSGTLTLPYDKHFLTLAHYCAKHIKDSHTVTCHLHLLTLPHHCVTHIKETQSCDIFTDDTNSPLCNMWKAVIPSLSFTHTDTNSPQCLVTNISRHITTDTSLCDFVTLSHTSRNTFTVMWQSFHDTNTLLCDTHQRQSHCHVSFIFTDTNSSLCNTHQRHSHAAYLLMTLTTHCVTHRRHLHCLRAFTFTDSPVCASHQGHSYHHVTFTVTDTSTQCHRTCTDKSQYLKKGPWRWVGYRFPTSYLPSGWLSQHMKIFPCINRNTHLKGRQSKNASWLVWKL